MPTRTASASSRDVQDARWITPPTVVIMILRLGGAGLLVVNAVIHGHLWSLGYRNIDTIGTLFLLDAVAAWVLAAVVLAAPRRVLAPIALLGALLELGTVTGLYLSTEHSLFDFVESSQAPYYWESANTEIVGTVVLAALAVAAFRSMRSRSATPRW